MKVIITGKTSYIGTHLCEFFELKGYSVKMVSLRDGLDKVDFSGYDVVVHCSAIVHKDEREYKNDYEKINHKLAVDTAKKARDEKVSQFIFLSSMSVYGTGCSKITKETEPKPNSLYGKTKLEAEKEILELNSDLFTVTVIRPPMVYGKGCIGNYMKLRDFIKKHKVFPKVNNKKSFINIKNLSFFIYSIIERQKSGIFMPMDEEYVSTTHLAENIAKAHNKKLRLSKFMGILISLVNAVGLNKTVKKAFGSLYYDESCATKVGYVSFEKGIKETESTKSTKKTTP